MTRILKKALPHIVAIIVFSGLSLAYFSPALDGMALRQHDVDNYKGMAREVMDWRKYHGEEPLWTDAPFGGMPATQISVVYQKNLLNYVQDVFTLWLPHPSKLLFLYMIGFYIMLMCMKVDPWLAIAGSIAYGFSSYFFTIMAAGHNTKAWAVGFMAPTFGAFVMTLREKKNLLLGGGLFALFFGLELKANHIQVTYYLIILMIFTGIYFLINAIKDKQIAAFGKKVGVLAVAIGLGAMANMANLYGTAEYSPHTQRGGSELTINPDGSPRADTGGGLDKSYITNWSYGQGETWSFFIPGAKGYWSMRVNGGMPTAVKEGLAKKFESDANPQIGKFVTSVTSPYWGDQGGTYGTTYIGAVVCFLFILGMFLMKDKMKWPLFVMTVLAIMLAWGKHFMWLTDLFLDVMPLYNKFRAVTIILVMAEFTIPLLGIMWLYELFKQDKPFQGMINFFGTAKIEARKVFYGVSGFVGLLLIAFYLAPEIFFDFMKQGESENLRASLVGQGIQGGQLETLTSEAVGVLKGGRITIFKEDVLRTLLFVVLTFGLLFAYMRGILKKSMVAAGIGLFALIDLWGVANIYLDNSEVEYPQVYGYSGYEYWQPVDEKFNPFVASNADNAIFNAELEADEELKQQVTSMANERINAEEEVSVRLRDRIRFGALNECTSYRVLTLNNPFNSSDLSYFHKSVGGYHAAKVQRWQDILDFYLYKTDTSGRRLADDCELLMAQNPATLKNANVLNMLNTRYIILQPEGQGIVDPNDPATFGNQNPAVLRNPFALGQAWFVNDFRITNGPDETILAVRQINPAKEAVVDQQFKDKLPTPSKDSSASVKMISYAPNRLEYEVFDLNADRLMVFSEVYYPIGWTLKVDGKDVEIFPVNYFLRGAVIPAGAKKIEMHYRPASFEWTSTVSLAGSGLILLLLAFLGLRKIMEVRKTNGA